MDGTLGDTCLTQMLCPLDHHIPGIISHIFIAQSGIFPPNVKRFTCVHIVRPCVVAFILTMRLNAHPHLASQRSTIPRILPHMYPSLRRCNAAAAPGKLTVTNFRQRQAIHVAYQTIGRPSTSRSLHFHTTPQFHNEIITMYGPVPSRTHPFGWVRSYYSVHPDHLQLFLQS